MAAILADDNFICIFLNENEGITIRISLKFVSRSPIDNKPALVQVMVWRRTGDKPLPESIGGDELNLVMLSRLSNSFEDQTQMAGAQTLTHCALVMLYGDRDLGQHWLR